MKKSPYIHHKEIHNHNSAKKFVDYLYDIFKPESVIDFGCGVGNFLYSFKKLGANRVIGLDGNWVNEKQLLDFLQRDEFISTDLTKSLEIQGEYDLALSLEVAEHIGEEYATQFVKNITKLSDVVVFSAAVPFQGGQNHVNEQWPEYWENIFLKYGYKKYDIIRPLIWNDPDILVWYKQNTFVYAKNKGEIADLKGSFETNTRLIHPDLYHYKARQLELIQSGRYAMVSYLKFFAKAILRRLKLYNS